MFHEVAHGLGVKQTINNKGTVRESLKEVYSSLEEGKADILGLYMIGKLIQMKQLEGNMNEHYVTFMAGILRSIRFGTSSAHGKANLLRFNFFQDFGAFTRDPQTGTYKVNFEKMPLAVNELSKQILSLQANGDYEGAKKFAEEKTHLNPDLEKDLARLKDANIPVDLVFEQGLEVLGLAQQSSTN
jgi:hypothetical protein